MKKFTIIFVLILLIAGIVLALFNHELIPHAGPGPTKEEILAQQKIAIAEMEARDNLKKTPTCDDLIIVTIADLTLSVPRYGRTIIDSAGNELDLLDHRCEIKRLNNIQSVSLGGVGLADRRILKNKFISYDRLKKEIDIGRANKNHTILSSGIERIVNQNTYLYILPQKTSPTIDGKPVVIECTIFGGNPHETRSSNFCSTDYLYKKNLIVSYQFFISDYSTENYIQADQDRRKIIDESIIKGK